MKTIEELKGAASQSLKDNKFFTAFCTLFFIFLFYVAPYLIVRPYLEATPEASFIEYLNMMLLLPMYWGFIILFLNLARSNSCHISDLFRGFNDYGRILGTMLLQTVYLFFWSLLFIIPGIVKSYSYALTPYILKDNSELRYDDAIEESMAMMNGHKKDLFLLDLSFIGWLILGCAFIGFIIFLFFSPEAQQFLFHNTYIKGGIRRGIGYLLIYIFYKLLCKIPYWLTSRAHFYIDLKAQQEQQ